MNTKCQNQNRLQYKSRYQLDVSLSLFYSSRVLFPRARLRGTQGAGSPLHHGATVGGSRSGSVARARGISSREIWQVNAGRPSAQLGRSYRPMETPSCPMLFFFFFHPAAVLLCCPQVPHATAGHRLGSHGTAAALEALCLCDSHERCCCVCARVFVQ